MKSLLRLTDFSMEEIHEIFKIADALSNGGYKNYLRGKSVILFLPASSIRTRISFEKGIYLLGGQSVLFSSETLDKKESVTDVTGYLGNWADLVIVRHKSIEKLEKIAKKSKVPVINAMTDINHPCEILSDLYALSKIREDFRHDRFLFVGKNGNIGLAWKEASEVLHFELSQCCGRGYEIDGLMSYHDIREAVVGKDIICTDSLPLDALEDFKTCQVDKAAMDMANEGAVLNPCPPFYRGEEVSEDAISSDYFVGYEFKKYLLVVQQAVMIFCMEKRSKPGGDIR